MAHARSPAGAPSAVTERGYNNTIELVSNAPGSGEALRRAGIGYVEVATLDTFRDTLDGDTDPVSGPVVLELK
jgi:hypothetical protein